MKLAVKQEQCNISFLDLTGLDGEEQCEVLSALQCTDPNVVQLPWDSKKEICSKALSSATKVAEQQEINSTKNVPTVWRTKKDWSKIYSSKAIVLNEVLVQESKSNNNNGMIDPVCQKMAVYLMSHTVDERSVSLQPRGLINRSNYCYMNSILQALLACPPMYNLLNGLEKGNTTTDKFFQTPIIDGMCLLVKEFKHFPAVQCLNRQNNTRNKREQHSANIVYDQPFEPYWMHKLLKGFKSNSFLVEDQQGDAEEFLGCLLNGMNDEMLRLIKLVKGDKQIPSKPETEESDDITSKTEFAKTPINDIFGGLLKSTIQRYGENPTYKYEPFFTLPLNIEKVNTVQAALQAFAKKGQLKGVQSFKTRRKKVKRSLQVTVEKLPVILVLHLKCFNYEIGGCKKNVRALEFPIDLRINAELFSSRSEEKQYKLFAVVFHEGKEIDRGHFTTDAYHVGYRNWLRYDDSSIKAVPEYQVINPQGTRVPYLLFYRRNDTIRST